MKISKRKRWLGVFTIGLFALLLIAFEVDFEGDPSPSNPNLIPHRVVLTLSGDPRSSMAAVWRTLGKPVKPYGEILEASKDPKSLQGETQRVEAITEEVGLDSDRVCYHHTVEYKNLKPSTAYAYRVGCEGTMSEWNHFVTAADGPEPFEFIYVGDAQNDILSRWSRTIRTAILDAQDSALVLHAGDLVNDPNNDYEWGQWFEAVGWANRVIPVIATPGNHEYERIRTHQNRITGVREFELSQYWKPQFAFPHNGPDGLEETVYYLDYQGVRFISLNSNVEIERQTEWLETILRDRRTQWTVVTLRHPLYTTRSNREYAEIREAWPPLFDRYGVDLVLSGHDHTYARSGKIFAHETVGNEDRGTVYAVSVSGPKMYEISSDHSDVYRMIAEDGQLYQVIRVDGDTLAYESKTCLGEMNDSFSLEKREDGRTILVESTPAAPVLEVAMERP